MEIICFHNPDEENGYLSNWYESKFIVDHVKFSSMEQFMVYEGLIAKFSQNEELKKQLKETKTAILAECALKDRIWGIGLSMKDLKRFDITQWRGQNLLGYALMEVRKRL